MSEKPKVSKFTNKYGDDLDAGLEQLSGIPGKDIEKLVAALHQVRGQMAAKGDHQKDINEMLGACVGVFLLQRL